MKRLLLFLSLAVLSLSVQAQSYIIKGKVVDEDDYPVSYATVALLSRTDSTHLAGGLTDENGEYSITCDSARVIGRISYIGMQTSYQFLEKGRPVTSILRMDTRELEEVVVEGDRTYRLKRTATGEIYYLSKYAKNSKNPFVALQEIPRLLVNPVLQSIKMQDGSSPLILIDGRSVNSGVAPLDPKEIASVEVVNVVDARYLTDNTRRIVNVRLKRKRKPYQWYQLATRHDIPIDKGFAVGYFEVGNTKLSLYGRAALDYTHYDKSEWQSWQRGTGYYREEEGHGRMKGSSKLGELLLKWSIGDHDYMAVHGYGNWNDSRNNQGGSGNIESGSNNRYAFSSLHNDKNYILTSSLYYEHNFEKNAKFDATLAYNYNDDRNDGEREENYQDNTYSYLFNYQNNRSSAMLKMNYSTSWNNVNSLNIGSSTKYFDDDIDKISEHLPIFHHRRWVEYLYASFSTQWKQLSFMSSAGMLGIWLKAGDTNNHYFKPYVSLSVNYPFKNNHSVNLSYQLDANQPSAGELNPYNTSTDPLVINRGNPYLKPSTNHQLSANYMFNYKNLNFLGSVNYSGRRNLIESFGYEEDGVFVSTFKNVGKYNYFDFSGYINYNFPKGRGRVYASAGYGKSRFDELSWKDNVWFNGGLWFYLKKWMIGGDINYSRYSYSPISRTHYIKPDYCQLQVNYNFTPNFYVAVLFPFVFGSETETETETAGYTAYNRQWRTGVTLRPSILIRYTIRKNPKRKIRLDNVVTSDEQGIKL